MSQSDVIGQASDLLALLDGGDTDGVWARVAPAARTDARHEAVRAWSAHIDPPVGAPRRVVDASVLPSDETGCPGARLVVPGAKSTLAVTVRFDDTGHVVALGVTPWVADGIRNIVIGCPHQDGIARTLADFYAELLSLRIVREDWIKVGKSLAEFPHLAFGDGWCDDRPPKWPDPEYSPQIHFDVFVQDVAAAGALAARLGGTAVRDQGDHATFLDPVGHPFCLMPAPGYSRDDGERRLGRIVFDCDDPEPMAAFYAGLLGVEERAESTTEHIVLKTAGTAPLLVFQHVSNYVSPRWQDPSYPAQVHLDLHFNDPGGAREAAEQLGALSLPPPRGSCPVYADPAGHPFCLCSSGGGEDEPYLAFI